MPKGPACRVSDTTAHGCPLTPGPGSANVLIGGMPAWRGLGGAAGSAITSAANNALTAMLAAQQIANAAAGTPGGPVAQANFVKTCVEQIANVSSQMLGSGADNLACPIAKGPIADGSGVVITGSETVQINGLAACRVGDTIQEVSSVNSVANGCATVMIGG